MKNIPLISVIIPVYNVEKYLEECLDSVLKQTYRNFEIICVNDGSTDNSLSILEKFQQKDSRIVIINQENKGAGPARNEGLRRAKGDFVYFIDPDDFFPSADVIFLLYKKITSKRALLCGGSCKILTDQIDLHSTFQKQCLFERDGWIESSDYPHPYGYWRFLYRTDFLIKNKLFFPNYRRYQDPPFFLNVLIKAERFYAVKKTVYVYRVAHKKVDYNYQKAEGLAKGLRDCLELSSHNNFAEMHGKLARSLYYSEYYSTLNLLVDKKEYLGLLKEVVNALNYQMILKNYPNFSLAGLRRFVSNNYKVSIIIPVYNVEKYLRQCIDSVLRQTYQNLEIICVNDGSTDNSLTILKEFQKKDPRIVIINQENKGLSAARNTGLKYVTSAYVSFIDSDDYVEPSYIEVLYNQLYKTNADFSLCNILPFPFNEKYENYIKSHIPHCSGVPINPNAIITMAWGKLFKVNIIKKYKLQFPEGLINEDNYWHFLYCIFSKKYAITHEKLYYHRKNNPNSIMSKTLFQKKHCYDIIKIYTQIYDFLSKTDRFEIYHNYVDEGFFHQLYFVIDNVRKKRSIDKVLLKEIIKYLARSKSAKAKFIKSEFFGMIEDGIW